MRQVRQERQSMVREAEGKVYSVKTSQFLSKNFQPFDLECSRINIQVSGQGVFQQDELLEKFLQHFEKVSKICASQRSQVQHIKLKISGFNICEKDIDRICGMLRRFQERNLRSLEIHTFGLLKMQLNSFQNILNLSEIGQHSDFAFTLQCANWQFDNRQPNLNQLQGVFERQINAAIRKIKKLRIQISGWYYTEDQGYQFLGFEKNRRNKDDLSQKLDWHVPENELHDRVERLHQRLLQFLQGVLGQRLSLLQLDLRNWVSLLRIKQFKAKADLKKFSDRQSGLSILSKFYGRKTNEQQLVVNIIV